MHLSLSFYKKKKNIEEMILNYKKHLRCWKDKEIMLRLAKIYLEQKNFYLAKMVYEEANAQKELKLIDIILKDLDTAENKQKFMQQSLKIAKDLQKEAKGQKQLAVALVTIGTVFAGTGLGFFIHRNAFDGKCPRLAYYSLMFGGLSLVGTGIANNYLSDYNSAISESYLAISKNNYAVGATPSQYYEFSGKEAKVKKMISKKLKIHGISLIILSVPLFALSVYSMHVAMNWILHHEPFPGDLGTSVALGLISVVLVGVGEMATFIPGIACLISGIRMIRASNKWDKRKKAPKVIELTKITPMINPITKTYGISMGFSF
jgi:hypothetical protein